MLVEAKFLAGCSKNCLPIPTEKKCSASLQNTGPSKKKMLVEAKLLAGCIKNDLPIPMKKNASVLVSMEIAGSSKNA
jgi:hypothetical protein